MTGNRYYNRTTSTGDLMNEVNALTRERDELRQEAGMLSAANIELSNQRDELRAEVERLTLADRQWADHVKRLSEENAQLRQRLANERRSQ